MPVAGAGTLSETFSDADLADFASRLESSSKTLWCIAAAALDDRTHAEDLVQEAALIALSKLQQGDDPPRHFVAWMGQIVRNLAINHNRRDIRRQTSATDPVVMDEALPVDSATEAHGLSGKGVLLDDSGQFDDHLLGALNALEETPRACLLLRTLLDMPYRDIALAIGVPEGTAMSHVHRARNGMRRQLASDDAPKVGKGGSS